MLRRFYRVLNCYGQDATEKPAKVSADVDLETSAVRNDEGGARV